MSSNPVLSAHLHLIGMALMWGGSWPAGRVIAQSMPPLAGACLRFVLASLVLLPWMYYSGGFDAVRRWSRMQWLGMLAAGVTGVYGYAAFFLSGLQYLPAGKAALIITLNPVVTLLLAVWIFREKLNAVIGLGMVLAAAGALVVISHGDPTAVLAGGMGMGKVLILACVGCWAAYTLLGRKLLTGIDALATTAITSVIGAVLLLLTTLALDGTAGLTAALNADAHAWGAMLFLAFGATALAYAWYFDGVKALGAAAASGYITLVPVIGVAISALLLGEHIDASMLIGGAMAVVGTAVMNWGRR